MKKIAIVTDTNSGFIPEEAKQFDNLFLIPMPFTIDGEEYLEYINLSQQEFYEKLKANADISTSQPGIGIVMELWDKILKDYDEIVHIPMSSSLSKSCETAKLFSQEYNGKVQVVDNQRISVTLKQSVIDAINLARDGKDAEEIKTYLEETKRDSSIYIMVDTLKYLKKGGRITPAAAMIGTLLKIRPVLQIQGGKLDSFAKVLNEKVGKMKMISAMKKDFETRFDSFVKNDEMVLYVAYTNCREKAELFAEQIKAEFPNTPIKFIESLPLSIACHIGDGSIAVASARRYKK